MSIDVPCGRCPRNGEASALTRGGWKLILNLDHNIISHLRIESCVLHDLLLP